MSSPERNCFLAAARTASFIASITRSLSIPCSWQSASIFCAIDELMFFQYRSYRSYRTYLRAAQLLADVNLQIGFSNQIQRNSHLPVSPVLKKHVVAIHSQQTTPKIALPINWLPGFHLRLAARETFEIGPFVQASLETGRRYLQSVGGVDEIFYIQNRPQMSAHFRAILVGYTVRLINEYTNNRLVLRAGYFGVNQLEAVVDCYLFSQFLNPCYNRFVCHCHFRGSRPKRKSGRETHRTRPRAFEQAVNYTERPGFKQPRSRVVYRALKLALTTSLTIRPSAFLLAKAAC